MTNEEAKVFLDNLKICIDEHPIVADWLVEIADRKTEPTISKMEQVDKDINVRGKWETPPKFEHKGFTTTCVSVPACLLEIEDEPQTYVINPQEPTNDDKCFECDDFFTCGGKCDKIEDEPQTDCAWGKDG